MIQKIPGQENAVALIVDDDRSMRMAMRAALTKHGFEVKEAENGRHGIEMFEAHQPDLILLDVMMPEIDGFEVCSTIRQKTGGEHIQIVMVTGLNDTESTERAFNAGADGFIAKPINWVMLGQRCKYMLKAGRAFQELYLSRSRLAKTQELAKLGNWEINLSTGAFSASPEACALLGLKGDASLVTYDDFFANIVDEEKGVTQELIESALKARKSFSVNYRVLLDNGYERHILNHGEMLSSNNQVQEVMLGVVQDVTQLQKAHEEIRFLAFYDGLTGLANRMYFINRLNHEIAMAKRNNQRFALLYLDLDHFKGVNDTFGHHIGDLLLKRISTVLRNCIRTTDIASRVSTDMVDPMIARLGGDEFTVLLTAIGAPGHVAAVARRIIKEIPVPYVLDGHEITVTASLGISLYPLDGEDANFLLKHADTAMYQAKNRGRNNFQFFKKSLNKAAVERFELEQDIFKALERKEFVLHYQPKINVRSGCVVGAEALIRWLHPRRGMVPPNDFIPIAEETGQIVSINEWVVEEACRQWKQWENDGYQPGIVAVNISGYQFAQQKVLETIQGGLEKAGLDPTHLEIEITENILMQDTKDTVEVLQQLKQLGTRIALDDFGTGYSSLSYLASFQVDTIKIDRSFVMGCDSKQKNTIIIKAIIAMGHSLGMKIVAEGVETDKEFGVIRHLGAEEAQGFLFSKAIPAAEFAKSIRTHTFCQHCAKPNG